jgi:invasion protein IalB
LHLNSLNFIVVVFDVAIIGDDEMINSIAAQTARGLTIVALGLLLGACAAVAQEAAPPAAKLANGANSLSETYDDWVLNCQATSKGTECGLLQVLSQQNGQRVLSFSVNPTPVNGNHVGSLILPFGLELAKGVTLQLDEQAVSQPLGFKTCLPAGCVVPLSWTAEQYNALRAANQLKLAASTAANEPFALTISLKGLSSAGKRALAIASQ